MIHKYEILSQLVAMSGNLGLPERDYIILGDGNTSARISKTTFWIKASGARLHNIQPDEFVEVRLDRVLGMLDAGELSDEEVEKFLAAAKVDPQDKNKPSIETSFHALAYELCGAAFVGHTHPVSLNSILCSQRVHEAISGNIFPEQVLYCGLAPAFVPYSDPGLPLAQQVRTSIQRYLDDFGEPPRMIFLQNHGLIALGKTSMEVENITAMCVKAARILLGTYLLGGPHFLDEEDVQRILTRPDELYRRKKANK